MNLSSLLTTTNIIIAASCILILLAGVLTVALAIQYNFKKRLLGLLDSPELLEMEKSKSFSRRQLLSRSNLVEKLSKKNGLELLDICRINTYWLEELKKHKSKKLYDRVLAYNPDRGLFTCFLLALEKKQYAYRFIQWLNNSEEFLIMRRIALSGSGEQFSGKRALELFADHLPQIREMTGDPEWASRYFAIKILLYDESNQSLRAIWESFRDSHPLIRKTIASEFQGDNREKLYNELYRLFLNDPVLEVRAAAKDRINKDFTDIYNINIDNLTTPEALHALEHLSAFSKADEDTAIRFLGNKNLELRFAAARFLEERGALNRLMEQADLGDREDLGRIENLLKKCCEVHITSFLEIAAKSRNPGVFYIAVDILTKTGDISLIEPVCSKIFSLPQDCIENKTLYDKALLCVSKRGSDLSLKHLQELLVKNRYNREYAAKILNALPSRGASFFIPILMEFLSEDPVFESRDELRAAINRMPSDFYIQNMLNIIKSGRDQYSHVVRKDALKILVELKQSFCLQTILENLPILPLDEAREFAKLLVEYDREEFDALTARLFESDDAAVRASLISCLPAINGKSFLKNIKESLSDADPEVRIASIWALVDFKETKTVSQAIAMLRDPVERVRIEVAKAIAETGSDGALEELRKILLDENEVNSVKTPAIQGLSASASLLSINILCELINITEDFNDQIITALSLKVSKKEINHIIEKFKDGSPLLRDKLTAVFSKMREAGEAILIELLKEDITALKPFICQVLENTGYIESLIRFLKHRDPLKRRKAASELSFIGTESAFRGIVLAARDSDEEVRISVTKALEKLNNSEGTKILKSLNNDPDKKVRKYTAWALERINSRNMAD
jgi:HEAT repeat protein